MTVGPCSGRHVDDMILKIKREAVQSNSVPIVLWTEMRDVTNTYVLNTTDVLYL